MMRSPLISAVGLGVAAAGVAGAMWALTQAFRREEEGEKEGSGERVERLLDFEVSLSMMDQVAVTTITFCKGDPAAAASHLSDRVDAIVAANPWLAGRLFKGTQYEKLAKGALARGMFLKKGIESLNRDQPLFRVFLVPDSSDPSGAFAVVMSMCHAIGDGHTFYSIHNMLSPGREVRALDPRRVHEAHPASEEAMGGIGGLSPGQQTPLWFLNMVQGVVQSKFGWKRVKACAAFVDKAFVRGAKERARLDGEVPFVSTNDVVSSEVFRSCPNADTLLMAVNFRNKLGCIDDSHAGNYENCIIYRPADVATPSLIRKSVQTLKPPTSLIRGTQHLGELYVCTTNWASFDQGLKLDGCETLLHMPLYDYADVTPVAVIMIVIIFRPCEGEVALLLLGTEDFLGRVRATGLIGKGLGVAFEGSPV